MNKGELTISGSSADKLVQLASLFEQAARLMREIGLNKKNDFQVDVPELKRPKHVPKDQEWFWSAEWQVMEKEADEALARGDYKEFDNVEDLIADLHAHV
jgi:hypothetical protein